MARLRKYAAWERISVPAWHSRALLLSSARRMTPLRAVLILTLGFLALPAALWGQQRTPSAIPWAITTLPGGSDIEYDLNTGEVRADNGVMVTYGDAVLTARKIVANPTNGVVVADGRVRIQQGDQLWASEHFLYNFCTKEIQGEQFRTGQAPLFIQGNGLSGDI